VIKHFHKRRQNVISVGDQLAGDLRLAQSKFEQAGDTVNPSSSRGRHAVESMRDVSHTVLEGSARILFPRIAMTATDRNPAAS